MTKYRLKPQVMDAWRVPATAETPRPEWLKRAFVHGKAWAQVVPDVPEIRITVLPSPQRPSEVAISGDWILHIEGALTVMPDETFSRLYEPEPETPAGGDGRHNRGEPE